MDEARLEKLTRMVGGRFKLTALVQKRMQELIGSEQGFGTPDVDKVFERVLREVEEGRIALQPPEKPGALPEGQEEKK